MIKSINIKNSISCVIIIFIFIIIKSLDASTPNSKLVLEASRDPHSKLGVDASRPTLECGPWRLQTHAQPPTGSGRVHAQPLGVSKKIDKPIKPRKPEKKLPKKPNRKKTELTD